MDAFLLSAERISDKKTDFNLNRFNNEVSEWEWKWVKKRKDYPLNTSGNSIETAIAMHQKYRKLIGQAHQ